MVYKIGFGVSLPSITDISGRLNLFTPHFEFAIFYFGFGGTVTYKNARQAVENALAVPKDRLLIETDSPYLPPVPHRGERNHSGNVRLVAEKLAELRGVSFEEIARITYENARRCFSI